MSPVLTPGKAPVGVRTQPITNLELVLARLAIAIGLALTFVGLIDVGLLWYPPRFGDTEWEFANLGSTFESLSLTTLGLALLAAGFTARGLKLALYIMACVFALFSLATLSGLALFGLNIPVALGGTPEALQTTVKMVLVKNIVLAVTYVALYSYFAYACFQQAKRIKKL